MSLTSQIKNFLKHKATVHKTVGQKDIFIFSTARSGTTWLAELITTQSDFRIVNEPFNIRVKVVRDNLGISSWEEVLAKKSKPKFKTYLNAFINGRDNDLRFNRPRIFSSQWRFKTSRIVFKILFAGEDNIKWFQENFNAHFIFLIRHPIPVALSRSVCPRVQSFLNSSFSKKHFTDEQVVYAQKIIKEGNQFEIAVLDWCLQNAIPLKNLTENDDLTNWLIISYEQMVMEPEKIIQVLVKKFQFNHPQLMYKQLYKASGSTVKSNKESREILLDPEKLKHNRKWLIEKWKDKVTEDQEQKTFEILKIFKIDFYSLNNYTPAGKYYL